MNDSYTYQAPFGDLLKAHRKRAKITQRQLAEKVGVHYNTVWAWECGEHLPDTRGLVLELARHLRLNDQETRLFLEASLTALSPYWHMPYLRNPFFTGRADLLRQLHDALCHDQDAILTQPQALSGLGGIGKTQIAIEYAYRYYQHYTAVFWIGAETEETIIASFSSIATLVHLPEKNKSDQDHVIAAVLAWLTCHRGWLMIFDNVEDPGLLKRFLPTARHGSLLFTSQRPTLDTLAWPLTVEQMSLEESTLFLRRRASLPQPDNEAIVAIGEALGGLPLALDQAAAYVEETRCGWRHFLQVFQAQPLYLLGERNAHAEHPASVTKTFALAFANVQQKNRVAADLLLLCTFLAPDAIPEEILTASIADSVQSMAAAVLQFNAAMRDLLTYALIQRNADMRTVTIHRLVQAVLKQLMDEETRHIWAEQAIRAVYQTFSSIDFSAWSQCERLLPHVLVCAINAEEKVANLQLADLLRKAADYLFERAQYRQAEVLYQRALAIRERVLGPEHSQVADALYGQGKLLYAQGQYERAGQIFQRALDIWEKGSDIAHSDVAEVLNGLANVSCELGQFERAETLYQRARSLWECALGPEHTEVAYALSGLAELYGGLERYELAESFHRQALHIREQAYGPDHPDVAYTLNRLADLLRERGSYEQAETLYQRALEAQEKALGPENVEVALSLSGLANLYREQGRYELAEPLYTRALHIREQEFGPDHPRLFPPLSGLANIARVQHNYELAETLYQRALSIWTHALGPENPRLLPLLNELAEFFAEQEQNEKAEQFYQHIHLIQKNSEGAGLPNEVL